MEEASRLCDRLVIVDRGKILVDGSQGPDPEACAHHVIEIAVPTSAARLSEGPPRRS